MILEIIGYGLLWIPVLLFLGIYFLFALRSSKKKFIKENMHSIEKRVRTELYEEDNK